MGVEPGIVAAIGPVETVELLAIRLLVDEPPHAGLGVHLQDMGG